MCELLGMSFNLPIKPSISFRGFRYRGEENPDGWGIAFYPDCKKAAQVIKEPITATKSNLLEFVRDYPRIESKIFVAHVRAASRGSKCYRNTHPFSRELDGKEYIFAHNGTLCSYQRLELGRFRPLGETDSEYVFCYLLNCIENSRITRWGNENFGWLVEKLNEINQFGRFNCIFSDGEFLFCYYDKNGYNGLCFVQRKAPYGEIRLLDEDWEINLAREKRPEETGYIIATNRLTNENWSTFRPGELIVFKDGWMIYSNKRNISKIPRDNLTNLEKEILRILRSSPSRVSLRKISEDAKQPSDDVKPAVRSLLCKGYIRQDARDEVDWNHPDATYYTEPSRREEIDKLIK